MHIILYIFFRAVKFMGGGIEKQYLYVATSYFEK